MPKQLLLGVAIIVIAWALSWFGPIRFGAHTFFPLWFGYIVTVDAVVRLRSGSSLLTRSKRSFAALFFISAPLWWLFELANIRLDNWFYHLPHSYSWLRYHAEATLAFSTVLPAFFETSELVSTTSLGRRRFQRVPFTLTSSRLYLISAAGAAVIAATLVFPGQLFPLIWIGGFLLLDPINARGGRPSLIASASEGRWSKIIMLASASLICGFFWEMWNIKAMPKWTYDIPYFEVLRLFEMPILGYGGYIPFAFELYAAYHLVTWVLPDRWVARLAIDQRGNDSREKDQA